MLKKKALYRCRQSRMTGCDIIRSSGSIIRRALDSVDLTNYFNGVCGPNLVSAKKLISSKARDVHTGLSRDKNMH